MVKRATSLFNLFCSKVARQVARFFARFYAHFNLNLFLFLMFSLFLPSWHLKLPWTLKVSWLQFSGRCFYPFNVVCFSCVCFSIGHSVQQERETARQHQPQLCWGLHWLRWQPSTEKFSRYELLESHHKFLCFKGLPGRVLLSHFTYTYIIV